MDNPDDLWVFGYGSLMWRPGFPYLERRHAHLFGYHRSLCIFSHVHRGTPDNPGLVLGLDRGGRCHGVAFRVAAHEIEATVHYLREREQATAVYLERRLPVRVGADETVSALAYVADRKHPQYAGRLSFDEVLRLVRQGQGVSGANPDYVRSTHEHLLGMGIVDPLLERITASLS
ncbi:gamma-glutamylcyclotransferase [Microvirga subterranea]|uniref:glutathione-specific gamma-glutamylcyclotransferase n=1 Tax=Microvirga subterranea TaxID=186651 RepID=A0A370HTR0_9HYPH|nr:gamma-glutamylcyclotransferase [Microvirga subterranea]RDI61902.1 cation transport protein ChaC [Microvirga subterranea]